MTSGDPGGFQNPKHRFRDDDGRPFEVGAVPGGQSVRGRTTASGGYALDDVHTLVVDADRVLGHNVIEHDLGKVVAKCWPDSPLLRLPVVDTLLLSPLAHTEKPYHKLLNDYKLTAGAGNDPLADAMLARSVFAEQQVEFRRRYPPATRILSVFRTWFAGLGANGDVSPLGDKGGLAMVFKELGGELLETRELRDAVLDAIGWLAKAA